MNFQTSIYDYLKPNYTSTDEISRYSAEINLENKIKLMKCCNKEPEIWFRSDTEYWIQCKVCGARSKVHKKTYQAMQAWDLGEREVEE